MGRRFRIRMRSTVAPALRHLSDLPRYRIVMVDLMLPVMACKPATSEASPRCGRGRVLRRTGGGYYTVAASDDCLAKQNVHPFCQHRVRRPTPSDCRPRAGTVSDMAIGATLSRPGVNPWPMDTIPIPQSPNDRPADALAGLPGDHPRRIRGRAGPYSSHITEWRGLRALDGLEALGRPRGPRRADLLVAKNEKARDKVTNSKRGSPEPRR